MNCVTAGNVMVQLFLQTKPKYYLNNKKLQYLLSIAQMSRLSYGETLFNDDIRNFKYNFVLDSITDNFVYNSAIVEGKTADKPLNLSPDNFVIPYNSKRIYAVNEEILEDDKKLLIDVFIKFGSFSEKTLCNFLNEFEPLRVVPYFSVVSKNKISEFFSNSCANGRFDKNQIFGFLKSVYLEHTVTEDASAAEKVNNDVLEPHKFTKIPEIPQPIVKKTNFLKNCMSLNNIIVGKKYSVLIETISSRIVEEVYVVSTNTQQVLPGELRKVSDTLYCFSFLGVPSDIRISVKYSV